MASAGPTISDIKNMMKAMWSAGDFGKIAEHSQGEGRQFVARLNLQPGMRVLDVGCGTGNQSLPAARTGARVTGVDITPNLLQQAAERAKQEGLDIDFREGDAEELPFAVGEFDVVMSMFGAMFAPRPEKVVDEFLRVCRPGGMIAMGNWTPSSYIGRQNQITSRYISPPPGMVSPFLWGEDSVVRERFGDRAEVKTELRPFTLAMPYGPREALVQLRQFLGPIRLAFARLEEPAQNAMAEDLIAFFTAENRGDDRHTLAHTEYLEVRATPAAKG